MKKLIVGFLILNSFSAFADSFQINMSKLHSIKIKKINITKFYSPFSDDQKVIFHCGEGTDKTDFDAKEAINVLDTNSGCQADSLTFTLYSPGYANRAFASINNYPVWCTEIAEPSARKHYVNLTYESLTGLKTTLLSCEVGNFSDHTMNGGYAEIVIESKL